MDTRTRSNCGVSASGSSKPTCCLPWAAPCTPHGTATLPGCAARCGGCIRAGVQPPLEREKLPQSLHGQRWDRIHPRLMLGRSRGSLCPPRPVLTLPEGREAEARQVPPQLAVAGCFLELPVRLRLVELDVAGVKGKHTGEQGPGASAGDQDSDGAKVCVSHCRGVTAALGTTGVCSQLLLKTGILGCISWPICSLRPWA